MRNAFKQLHDGELPPQEVKRHVMNELDHYELLSEMINLFVGGFIRTELDFFNIPDAPQKKSSEKRSEL